MKRSVFLLSIVLALGFTFTVEDAEARRLGGGSSFGMKRGSGITQRQATPPAAPSRSVNQAQQPANAAAAAPAAAQRSGMSRFMGPLAGLAAGLGLAALFSHLGMGAEMGSFLLMLLLGVGVFLILRAVLRRGAATGPRPAHATSYSGLGQSAGQADLAGTAQPGQPSADNAATRPADLAAAGIPADFDAEGFLRQAKLNFIRLQAANDAGNMDDIRAFTSPEVYAEIELQYRERGRASQETDVQELEAQLLDVSLEAGQQIASLRFSGSLRENDGAAERFAEVWHLARPQDGRSGWIIAGIEQLT